MSARGAAFLVAVLGIAACESSDLGAVGVRLGAEPAALAYQDTPLGLSRSATFEVVNAGGTALTGLQISMPPPVAPAASVPTELAPGARFTVEVVFTPAVLGRAAGTATIAAAGVDSAVVALSGAGVPPPECDDGNPCTR